MNIIKDVDLINDVDKYDVILLGTSTYYALNNGFQKKVATNYPYVAKMNETIRYGDNRQLGKVLEAKENGQPTFCLLYMAKGYGFRPDLQKEFICYDSLEKCLRIVNTLYKGKNIASPIIGSTPFDGNGDKDKIIQMFSDLLSDCNVTLYDYVQKSDRDEQRDEYLAHKAMGREAFYEYIRERKLKNKIKIKNEKNNQIE